MDGDFGQRLERLRLVDGRMQRQRDRRDHGRVVDGDLHQSLRRQRRLHADAKQPQEREALALGDQVGAVKDGVAEPGEQVDQRAPRIALARVGVFRRVRRNTADQICDEVVEAAVVERGRSDRHQPAPTGTSALITAAAPVSDSR